MRSLAIQETVNSNVNYYDHLPKTSISLNHMELKCLEMAFYFLTEQCYSKNPHFVFTQFKDQHLRSLHRWFNHSKLKKLKVQLRFNDRMQLEWPINTKDDFTWLLLALEVGMTGDTVLLMAADEANYARDMELQYAETDEDCDVFYLHYRELRHYYSEIAQCSSQLLAKFRDILEF
jgi:hypothetical protein